MPPDDTIQFAGRKFILWNERGIQFPRVYLFSFEYKSLAAYLLLLPLSGNQPGHLDSYSDMYLCARNILSIGCFWHSCMISFKSFEVIQLRHGFYYDLFWTVKSCSSILTSSSRFPSVAHFSWMQSPVGFQLHFERIWETLWEPQKKTNWRLLSTPMYLNSSLTCWMTN